MCGLSSTSEAENSFDRDQTPSAGFLGPIDKPILVSCASGYRSATASSMIKKLLPDAQVYDLGTDVVEYKNAAAKK